MYTLSELKKAPVEIDAWMVEQVGYDSDGPYKQEYPKIKNKNTLEPLVNISEYGIVSSDYYLVEFLSGKTYLQEAVDKGLVGWAAYLRKSHATRLQKVDEFLRNHGLFVHVQSGWRHPKLQEIVKHQYAEEHGEEKASRLFAPIPEGAATTPHATGAAFDLEIRSLTDGKRQELYWSINGKNIYGAPELEHLVLSSNELKSNKLVQQVIENRRVLFHCLCSKGVVFDNNKDLFTPHPGECWHFGDGDPLSAYLRQEDYARYGRIEPQT